MALTNLREIGDGASSDVSPRLITLMQLLSREAGHKSVDFDLFEAASLNTVRVHLNIDIEAILKLQRKVHDYSENRV